MATKPQTSRGFPRFSHGPQADPGARTRPEETSVGLTFSTVTSHVSLDQCLQKRWEIPRVYIYMYMNMYIYIYICIWICIYIYILYIMLMCIYIYSYNYREREGEREREILMRLTYIALYLVFFQNTRLQRCIQVVPRCSALRGHLHDAILVLEDGTMGYSGRTRIGILFFGDMITDDSICFDLCFDLCILYMFWSGINSFNTKLW